MDMVSTSLLSTLPAHITWRPYHENDEYPPTHTPIPASQTFPLNMRGTHLKVTGLFPETTSSPTQRSLPQNSIPNPANSPECREIHATSDLWVTCDHHQDAPKSRCQSQPKSHLLHFVIPIPQPAPQELPITAFPRISNLLQRRKEANATRKRKKMK